MTRLDPATRDCDPQTVLDQIGRMNVLAISGGRVQVYDDGVVLPVGSGYSVHVFLAADDTYTVRRVFKRGPKTWIKGQQTGVYFDEVGEAAYQASCFRNGDWHPLAEAVIA